VFPVVWGMPPWTAPTPQLQRPSYSPPTVCHLCLLLIVPFVIRTNVKRLAYLSIYVFKRHSLSAGRDFIDGVLTMEGSGEGEGGGTSNDAAPWLSCMWCICVVKWWLCIVMWRLYKLSLIYVFLCEYYMYYCINQLYDLFWRLSIRAAKIRVIYIYKLISYLVNRGTYGHIFLG
jgi:hypothetical protein